MKRLLIKIALFIFTILMLACLGLGIYSQDLLITAIGILLIFCIILLSLEYKKMLSNPFD
ncbi:hypothetical protein B9T29_00625 [Acinetobacter sp. ANC 3903]|nr:hypothetical protein B9T29_00625 [Acinetobacter sp. ANC 3903]